MKIKCFKKQRKVNAFYKLRAWDIFERGRLKVLFLERRTNCPHDHSSYSDCETHSVQPVSCGRKAPPPGTSYSRCSIPVRRPSRTRRLFPGPPLQGEGKEPLEKRLEPGGLESRERLVVGHFAIDWRWARGGSGGGVLALTERRGEQSWSERHARSKREGAEEKEKRMMSRLRRLSSSGGPSC